MKVLSPLAILEHLFKVTLDFSYIFDTVCIEYPNDYKFDPVSCISTCLN